MPLCTHEGSGMGRSESDIKKLCPKANVRHGLPRKGSYVNTAKKQSNNGCQKGSNGMNHLVYDIPDAKNEWCEPVGEDIDEKLL